MLLHDRAVLLRGPTYRPLGMSVVYTRGRIDHRSGVVLRAGSTSPSRVFEHVRGVGLIE